MFVPAEYEPPRALEGEGFRLEPLGPEHSERDYAAWTASLAHIRASPGYGDGAKWPHPMTPEQNLEDLERHAHDFVARTGFTYTVLDSDGDVVGCVYIYPAPDDVHDARITSWVRASRAELDRPLRRAVAAWLAEEWPFVRPLYEPLLD